MNALADLAAAVPEVAEYERLTGLQEKPSETNWHGRRRGLTQIWLADAALAATVAYYEKKLLERERCGGCDEWDHYREDCPLGKNGWFRTAAYDRCHFITPDHPHGKFEPIGGE